jgi:dihydropteroate synthase
MHTWQLSGRTLVIERPLVMGILNVTPDSFSDGGRHAAVEAAIAHGLDLARQGADLIDVGGESTRPGSQPISPEEELCRVLPVVEGLAASLSIPISIDTSKPATARACLAAGVHIINDVTGLAEPAMAEAVRDASAGVILMHMQGTPATMQDHPHYEDVTADLGQYFQERLNYAARVGIPVERIVLDPGIGFGKTFAHNLEILERLQEFQRFGRPVCLGVSRKGFIGRVLNRPIEQRLAGSLAVAGFALSRQSAQILRVHDVAETVDVVRMMAALASGARQPPE